MPSRPELEKTVPSALSLERLPLAELHVHVGSAVDPAILWSICHSQGIKLPTKDYWAFVDLVTVDLNKEKSFDDYLALFHWTEEIQSSPEAIERSVYEVIGGAYRKNNIQLCELRFNPMKRNRHGQRDLDHIIHAAIRGMERAQLEYPVQVGLIFCFDKAFDLHLNEIMLDKAISYRHRGVVGVDMAGPEPAGYRFSEHAELMRRAREAGLGVTVHAGESGSVEAMREAITALQPTRIGHGIKAARDPELLALLKERDILLELCPSSNLQTGVVASWEEFGEILGIFRAAGIKYCFNTDGPEMLRTGVRKEIQALLDRGFLTLDQVAQSNRWAYEYSFIQGVRSPGAVAAH